MIFAFDDHRLDVERRELRRGGDVVELQPQVFDLLVYLVRQRHRVVSKADLLQAVWAGRTVSDSAMAARINAARRAIGDDGAAQRLIRTFTRKGVRFIGHVAETPGRPEPVATPIGWGTVVPDPRAPSIAVRTFANLSDDHELDHLAAGTVEEITIALSRIPWLLMIYREAGLAHAGIAAEPSVRYALEGSVRRGGSRIRIAAHLVDVKSGVCLWADHFDGSPEGVLELQDEAASRIAGVVEPVLQAFEAERALDHRSEEVSAYDAYLRAYAMVSGSARRIPAALSLLEEAITSEPEYGPALALAANYQMRSCMDGISSNPAADARKGAGYARRALQVAPDDPGVLANSARPLAYSGENIDTTIALMDRALEINPSFARGWYIRGFLKYWAGDLEASIQEVEAALRLSPHGRFGTPLTAIANALEFGRRFDEAIPMLHLAIQRDPSFPPNYRLLAVCHAHLGQLEEAHAALGRLPRTAPVSIPKLTRSYRAMFRSSEHLNLALSGLRLAAGLRT